MVRCAIGPCRSDGWIKPGTETRLIRPGHFDEHLKEYSHENGENKRHDAIDSSYIYQRMGNYTT